MKSKQLRKILLSSLLSVGVLASSSLTAFADVQGPVEVQYNGGKTIESTEVSNGKVTETKKDEEEKAYGESHSDLRIKGQATNVNVTVPTTVPFEFDANGDTLVPNNFIVTNHSAIAGIYLENITLDSQKAGWRVVDDQLDLTQMSVDSKDVRIKFGKKEGEGAVMRLIAPSGARGKGVSRIGSASFDNSEINIQAKKTQKLDFEVEHGAFSKDIVDGKAFDMTLQFRFQ